MQRNGLAKIALHSSSRPGIIRCFPQVVSVFSYLDTGQKGLRCDVMGSRLARSHAFFTFVVLLGSVAALFHVYKRYVTTSPRTTQGQLDTMEGGRNRLTV